jgi:hypothetical protein
MSRSSGPGSPSWFKCTACRSTVNRDPRRGKYPVTRTGRTKPRSRGAALGVRHGHTMHEYRCGCGFVGWSAHNDVARLPVVPR